MTKFFPVRKTIRVASLFCAPLFLSISVFLLHEAFSADLLLDSFLMSDMLYLTYPLSYESPVPSLLSAAALLVLAAGLSLLGIPPVTTAALVICGYLSYRMRERVIGIRRLFRNDVPWLYMETCCRFMDIVAVLSLCLWRGVGGVWILLGLAVALFLMQHYYAYTGHLFIMGRSKEEMLRNLIKGDLRSVAAAAYSDDARMNALYAKVVSYMEERKPYLQENFSLEEFSRILFTNKTYLSRVINHYSGRNFKQFINYYRVQYSVELIKKDPRLTVMELASMSGFHSVVTYNVAFRINMNDTPGSYSKCLIRD